MLTLNQWSIFLKSVFAIVKWGTTGLSPCFISGSWFSLSLKAKWQTCRALLFYLSISHHVLWHTNPVRGLEIGLLSGKVEALTSCRCESLGEHAWRCSLLPNDAFMRLLPYAGLPALPLCDIWLHTPSLVFFFSAHKTLLHQIYTSLCLYFQLFEPHVPSSSTSPFLSPPMSSSTPLTPRFFFFHLCREQ